ncbi:fatty acid desaturase [Pontiella sulfatireligans]|uniref:Fatty acid desaturase domain-containing protein n=1 Tax=Pontiella sulfatireligans TaxID=2750658 RepID=A0A6C2UDD1_9BACT|nr:fatty acid desaturase [Pontiella sulfatireligans]VGO18198.1 hypothetical protein SCARR_00249 [Pontiella sulfatireligans]
MTMLMEKKVDWLRIPIDKAIRKKLMERSDARGFLQIIPQLLFSVLTGAGVVYSFYHLPWPFTLLALFIRGTCFTFLGEHAAIHELSHGTVFKTKGLNEFFLRLCGFITWKNVIFYRASHIRHHMATVHRDQDLEVPLPYRITLWQWIQYYTFDFTRFQSCAGMILRHSFGMLSGDWENHLFPETDQKARKQLFGFSRAVFIGQLCILSLILYLKLWILLAIFTVPFYATWLAWLVTIPQHAGLQPDSTDFRLCCRSAKVDPFTLFMHWKMDYHVEHHMHAGIPFYNLPKLRKAIEGNLPPMDGFFKTWREIRCTLKRQKKEPGYYYTPSLPPTETEQALDPAV